MNPNPTTGSLMNHWGSVKESLKRKYAHLTDNDLAYIKDCEDEILLQIQHKTGASREELDQCVREACAAAA